MNNISGRHKVEYYCTNETCPRHSPNIFSEQLTDELTNF